MNKYSLYLTRTRTSVIGNTSSVLYHWTIKSVISLVNASSSYVTNSNLVHDGGSNPGQVQGIFIHKGPLKVKVL